MDDFDLFLDFFSPNACRRLLNHHTMSFYGISSTSDLTAFLRAGLAFDLIDSTTLFPEVFL
jgi:hypothetical protein